MASALWEAQPESEKSLLNKVCAMCNVKPASMVCTRCRCTRYCGRECQKKHWTEGGHKQQCSLDPLYHLSGVPIPKYRTYTPNELKEEHSAYILQPGLLYGTEIDDRDSYCRLVVPASQEIVDCYRKVAPSFNGAIKTGTTAEVKLRKLMGWNHIGKNSALGYSYEDRQVFRVLFDFNHLSRSDLEGNNIAQTLVQMESSPRRQCRGKFLVVKVDKDVTSKPIPFPKSELVDLMVWRLYLGRFRLISTRMFRENMRRREFKVAIEKQGVKAIYM